jgi:thioredoxin-related protein
MRRFYTAVPDTPEPVVRSGLVSVLKSIVIAFCLFISPLHLSAEEQNTRELVLVTSDHCPFCKAWERDVGAIYEETPYARHARLRRVDIADVDTALPELSAEVFGTPTFLILEKNTEIGRIEGYQSSEMFFWALSEYISP